MKYQLNPLPVKTTNGFHINDVTVEMDIPSFSMSEDILIEGTISSLVIQKEIKKEKLSSRLGLECQDYLDLTIRVPKGIVIEEPIAITYACQKNDSIFSNIHIVYEENASCSFFIQCVSQDENPHFVYLVERVTSSQNSSGNVTIFNHMNSHSSFFYALENDVLEKGNIQHTILDLGGKTRLYHAYSRALGSKSHNTLQTIYIGKEDALLDFNYYLKNIGEESVNQMKVEGLLDGNSHKNFRGTIDFVKGCSRSIGEENENCILLSDTCQSRSLPQMLCGEEDVVGSHGVSSGKVDEEKLFYLMSRGYSEKEAERLIVMGRFESILESIPSSMRDSVHSLIEESIS